MQFSRIDPPHELKNIVECYWIAEDSNTNPILQKIVPDGFPEIIFHFGDPYRIKLDVQWELQAKSLLAGQITKFFFLENTGRADILGIKLKPAALAFLFDIETSMLTDTVVPLSDSKISELVWMDSLIRSETNHQERITIINKNLMELSSSMKIHASVEKTLEAVFSTNGLTTVASMCEQGSVTERQAERLFKKYVGLSPKFYARVIRFSNIFQVAQQKKLSWSEVGLESGFYDQAHFIKDFKAFTGEDPSRYFFDEPTLANFFMKKI